MNDSHLHNNIILRNYGCLYLFCQSNERFSLYASTDNKLLQSILEDIRKKTEEDEAAAQAAAQAAGKGRSNRKTKSSFQFKSVGTRFKQQLVDLMTALEKTDPHYIRCIKPNPQNKARLFDPPYNLEQLRCGGVLEAVRVTQAGFPTRKIYAEFVDRYLHMPIYNLFENFDPLISKLEKILQTGFAFSSLDIRHQKLTRTIEKSAKTSAKSLNFMTVSWERLKSSYVLAS